VDGVDCRRSVDIIRTGERPLSAQKGTNMGIVPIVIGFFLLSKHQNPQAAAASKKQAAAKKVASKAWPQAKKAAAASPQGRAAAAASRFASRIRRK